MKKLHIALFGCLLCWICTASAQSVGHQMSEEQYLLQSLSSREVSATQLSIFQERAEQKIRDWFDYVQALVSTDYPADMEAHLREMAEALFVGRKGTVMGEPVQQYLTQVEQSLNSTEITLTWLGWEKRKNGDYLGTLLLHSDSKEERTINVELSREKKSFGSETQEIWAVYLTSIK